MSPRPHLHPEFVLPETKETLFIESPKTKEKQEIANDFSLAGDDL